jgi:hypothetical protein
MQETPYVFVVPAEVDKETLKALDSFLRGPMPVLREDSQFALSYEIQKRVETPQQ